VIVIVFVTAAVQPKDDIVQFWQSVVGPHFDIVVSFLFKHLKINVYS